MVDLYVHNELWGSMKAGNFLASGATINFPKKTLHHKVSERERERERESVK
jgi:hypothetical protein